MGMGLSTPDPVDPFVAPAQPEPVAAGVLFWAGPPVPSLTPLRHIFAQTGPYNLKELTVI